MILKDSTGIVINWINLLDAPEHCSPMESTGEHMSVPGARVCDGKTFVPNVPPSLGALVSGGDCSDGETSAPNVSPWRGSAAMRAPR